MSQILVYSRAQPTQINKSVEIVCAKLTEIGHHTEQTHSTNWARLLLNEYHLIHLFVEKLPLTVNEMLFISFAKVLSKPTVLSLFNTEQKMTKPISSSVCPDALTVSQTNHLQYYRDWICSKSLLPLFPELNSKKNSAENNTTENRAFLIPLENELTEVFQYKTNHETYFDARLLLKNNTSTALRKKWNSLQQNKELKSHFHLILSEEKITELLTHEHLQIVLASPNLRHTDFTKWIEVTLNRGHLLYVNDFQATGFSQAWTSGHNAIVISSHHWPQNFNSFISLESDTSKIKSHFKMSELTEHLINDLSRLYTKILRQKTTLISSDSVKIKS